MKRISRRNFLKVAGVSAAALGLAACGGSKSGSTATSGSTAGSTAGGVNTAGFTVQYGSNPETLDPALMLLAFLTSAPLHGQEKKDTLTFRIMGYNAVTTLTYRVL